MHSGGQGQQSAGEARRGCASPATLITRCPSHWLRKMTSAQQEYSAARPQETRLGTAEAGKGLDGCRGCGCPLPPPRLSWQAPGTARAAPLTALELVAVVSTVGPAVTAQLVPDAAPRVAHELPWARCRGEGRPGVPPPPLPLQLAPCFPPRQSQPPHHTEDERENVPASPAQRGAGRQLAPSPRRQGAGILRAGAGRLTQGPS